MDFKTQTQFPPAWLWLMDEAVPTWVKKHYSPRETWKDKPFSKEDARFFFKGIEELSDLFTEERPKGMPPYFQHPRYRSGYLLYFLPLQAAKFLTLFGIFPKAIEAAMEHARKTGVMRVADLGSGPGTASLALLLLLLNYKLKLGEELPQVELDWFDTNLDTMKDGQELVEQLSSHFPKLRGKVKVRTHLTPWWKAPSKLPNDLSLVFLGHVLNESTSPKNENSQFWEKLLSQTSGGGILMMEPAARRPAQTLSKIRDELFEVKLLDETPAQIWGPCLHAGRCPLSDGRDWCHNSVPAHIPGKWFKDFSTALGSERHWVKFSYLWLASRDYPAPIAHPQMRRVISDPLSQSARPDVLICEPETPNRWTIGAKATVHRGDLIKIAPIKK
jgi:hypothetical protein